jgi:hypothetical protein
MALVFSKKFGGGRRSRTHVPSLRGCDLNSPVLRQNSESTERHSLTILQPCLQAVDLKIDRHFGEGQG